MRFLHPGHDKPGAGNWSGEDCPRLHCKTGKAFSVHSSQITGLSLLTDVQKLSISCCSSDLLHLKTVSMQGLEKFF
jgi:hypothetical protein